MSNNQNLSKNIKRLRGAKVYRILDVNLNRLREGLRALEEDARFLRGDKALSTRLKDIRHKLKKASFCISTDKLLQSRDSIGDVGFDIDQPGEKSRRSSSDVADSNFKRAQEAARVLEEYGKLVDPEFSMSFKEIRYTLYTIEQEFSKRRKLDFHLYLLVSGPEGLKDAIDGGVDLVQFRDKSSCDRVRLNRLTKVISITESTGVPLIVNDRPDICLLSGAAGVHLGQDDLPIEEGRRLLGPGRIIGCSTYNIKQAIAADKAGADYVAIGSVFPTDSKEVQIKDIIGIDVVKEVVKKVKAPLVAIGGIDKTNIEDVLKVGIQRVAMIKGILGEGNPKLNARAIRNIMSRYE